MFKWIKYTFTIAIALFYGQWLFAQKIDYPFSQEEIDHLERRIMNLYEKETHKTTDSLHFIHVFNVSWDGKSNKEAFMNTSFLRNLEPFYFRIKRKQYLSTDSFLGEKNGRIVAGCSGYSFYNSCGLYGQSFFDTLNTRHITTVYKIYLDCPHSFLIGVTDKGEPCLIDHRKRSYKVYPISKCTDLQWDYIVHEKEELKIDTANRRMKMDVVK
ncbi:MAG: hypothetical protein ACTTKO_01425 [Candidatus Limimorpha sp.]